MPDEQREQRQPKPKAEPKAEQVEPEQVEPEQPKPEQQVEVEQHEGALLDDPNREAVGLEPIWTGSDETAAPAATGATAGTPGTFTPDGAAPPADVAGMSSLTASPPELWQIGEYVQTGTAGAAGEAWWDGTAWQAGKAPAVQETGEGS